MTTPVCERLRGNWEIDGFREQPDSGARAVGEGKRKDGLRKNARSREDPHGLGVTM
jgi:hypothetical protein